MNGPGDSIQTNDAPKIRMTQMIAAGANDVAIKRVITRGGRVSIYLPRGDKSGSVRLVRDVWSERRDSNSGPPVPQTGALTGLRYAPPVAPRLRWPRRPRKGVGLPPQWRARGNSGEATAFRRRVDYVASGRDIQRTSGIAGSNQASPATT